MKRNIPEFSKIKKTNIEQEKGLTETEKLKMFFFGFIIVIISGTRVFYNLPGNATQKRQTLFYYISGLLFWIILIGIIIYLSEL